VEFGPNLQVLLGGFVIALILGAVANKTHFCTMGAVSDWVNIGDSGRMRAWLLALTVALLGVLVLENLGLVTFDDTRPPYRTANFAWARYLVGGMLFGIGMTLASGCGNKNLVRIGGGNLKAVVVVLVAGYFAYLMTRTDFYGIVFHSWVQPIAINLGAAGVVGQDLGSLAAAFTGDDPGMLRLVIGGGLALLLLIVLFRSADFRANRDNLFGGTVVGLCVLGAWYLTGGTLGQSAIEEAEWMDIRPDGVGVQSYTFINPMGEALYFVANGASRTLLTFGVVAFAGVIMGSFLYALFSRGFRIEWFTSLADFVRHVIGGALMGIGGVLAMGCTIGQGITGVSTLALGSILALGAIILGSAATMKVQYYKMLYEDASFGAALTSGLVDLHLLPRGMRKLEAL
jgi:uncharacterized membrane protein YedE/YeeE